MTVALQQQVKKVDDKALKDAPKGTEWLSHGMGWSEQRYTTMTQINPTNIKNLSLAWTYEIGPGGDAQKTNPLLFRTASSIGISNWSSRLRSRLRKPARNCWNYEPEIDARDEGRIPGARLCCGYQQPRHRAYEGKSLVPVVDGKYSGDRRGHWKAALVFLGDSSNPSPATRCLVYSIHRWRRASRKEKSSSAMPAASSRHSVVMCPAFDAEHRQRNCGSSTSRRAIPAKAFEQKAMEAQAKDVGRANGGSRAAADPCGMAWPTIPMKTSCYIGTGNGATWAADVRNGGQEPATLDNLYIASIVAVNARTVSTSGTINARRATSGTTTPFST
jgi:hypothetical protein